MDIPVSFYHNNMKDRGLGIPFLQKTIPKSIIKRASKFRDSNDPTIIDLTGTTSFQNLMCRCCTILKVTSIEAGLSLDICLYWSRKMANVSDESSCIYEDFENFVSPRVLQTNLTLETPKAFIEDLDKSYEEFQNCVEDIVLEIIKKLHKNKKKIDFGNVIKNAIKVDISEVQTRKALDQLISRRMLRSVITSGKESFRIMNSNGSCVNPYKCTGECYVQLSNICEQIKALDVKMGQRLSVSNVVEERNRKSDGTFRFIYWCY